MIRRDVEQLAGNPESREREDDGDADGRSDDGRIVDDRSAHSHALHAGVVHTGDGHAHEDAGEGNKTEAGSGAIEDEEYNRGGDYGGNSGCDDEEDVVPSRHRRLEREHADEVSAPQSECQRYRAGISPPRAASSLAGADPLRYLDSNVGADDSDNDGENYESEAI